MIQSLIEASGCQENAVLAHGADASKADCTWATQLTADQQQEVALLAVNCINWN